MGEGERWPGGGGRPVRPNWIFVRMVGGREGGGNYRVSTGNLKLSTQGPSYCIQSSGTENTKLNCLPARNVTLPREKIVLQFQTCCLFVIKLFLTVN